MAVAFLLVMLCVAPQIAAGQDAEDLVSKLEVTLAGVVEEGNSPSLQVAVVHGGQLIWSRGYGAQSGTDILYMNASVQKVFDAVAVLQLVEAGKIDLDADINTLLPFDVRHPGFPDTPITARMLLAHRSGLDAVPHQFGWDTRSAFAPEYRPPCPPELEQMPLGEFLSESLSPGAANYDTKSWRFEPGDHYRYSVSAYPLLKLLVEAASGQVFSDYMRDNVFEPLGMTNSSFDPGGSFARQAIPYTRINGDNIEIPFWTGNGYMLHTTAEEQAGLMIALMDGGRAGDSVLLRPETIDLMSVPASRFRVLFKRSRDQQPTGHGLGIFLFRGGWMGYGGSSPGFQNLWRYHPEKRIGFVIMSNVNGILGGGRNSASARNDIYPVQDALLSILDPTLRVRNRAAEIGVVGTIVLVWLLIAVRLRRSARARRRS